MNRRDFIKTLGLVSASVLYPFNIKSEINPLNDIEKSLLNDLIKYSQSFDYFQWKDDRLVDIKKHCQIRSEILDNYKNDNYTIRYITYDTTEKNIVFTEFEETRLYSYIVIIDYYDIKTWYIVDFNNIKVVKFDYKNNIELYNKTIKTRQEDSILIQAKSNVNEELIVKNRPVYHLDSYIINNKFNNCRINDSINNIMDLIINKKYNYLEDNILRYINHNKYDICGKKYGLGKTKSIYFYNGADVYIRYKPKDEYKKYFIYNHNKFIFKEYDIRIRRYVIEENNLIMCDCWFNPIYINTNATKENKREFTAIFSGVHKKLTII